MGKNVAQLNQTSTSPFQLYPATSQHTVDPVSIEAWQRHQWPPNTTMISKMRGCGEQGSRKKPCPEAVDHLSIVLVFCSRSWSSIRISSAQLCSSNLWWPPEWPVSYTVWLDRLKLPSTPPTPKINEPGVLSLGPKISLASLVSSSKNRCCRNALGPAMGSSIRIHHALCYMNRLNLSHR